jgi:hypothetical protein
VDANEIDLAPSAQDVHLLDLNHLVFDVAHRRAQKNRRELVNLHVGVGYLDLMVLIQVEMMKIVDVSY